MAKIGRLFKVQFQEYNIYGTELLHEYTGYFGLSVGSIISDSISNGNSNFDWFANKIESDVTFLGMSMQTWPGNPSPIQPDAWLPQCKFNDEAEFLFHPTNRNWRILFGDGDYVNFSSTAGPNTAMCHWGDSFSAPFAGGGYDLAFAPLMTSTYGSGRYIDGCWGRAFVVNKMTDDGHIPDNEEVGWAVYKIGLRKNSNTGYPMPDQNPDLYITSGGNMSSNMITFWNYIIDKYALSTDPYAPGGIAEPGGGDGTFDWESDIVPVQPLPEISVTDAGFVNLYVPTKAQLQNLCRYLWSSAFDIDSLKRIFLEPMDVIIGLSILPVTPEELDADLGTILVGQYSSGISSYVAHRQYVQVDCGTVTIEPKWGAYLDFSPYSKLQMYLPYIGFVDITPDDCMNGTIHVVYNLDILSGACLAQIECTTPGKDGEPNSHVLYEYTGNCSVECPITSGQYRNIISSMFNIASGVVETTATGNPTPILNSVIDTVKGITKPTVSRAGGPGKNTGILGHQAPFLVLTCPRMIIPGQQNAMIGYPSYVTLNLGDLNGYTQIDTIHLAGVPASKDEQDEIIDLLQKGVFL